MNRILVHMACPFSKRSVANALAGLSGRSDEHSIPLRSVAGKPAAIWDGIRGYPQGQWLGASQSLAPAIVQAMFTDAMAKKPESYFVAYDELTGTKIDTNCPAWPADATLAAFLALLGLELDSEQK